MLRMRALAALFGALVVIAGCSRADRNATDEPVSSTTVTSAPVVTRAWTPEAEQESRLAATNAIDLDDSEPVDTDETVSFRLQRALLTDPAVVDDAEHVSVEVVQGIATLRGTATKPETRTAIQRLASATAGVVVVVNRIAVRPAD